ncbi:hypothetical protein [Methanococcus maripaludis]|uniref:Uncharacterized protein n=1 Tax=Methanococcus maripaludis TaxID=39152 RepID=A0A8T4CJC3_METMI|nr:hypothetical protein [Methanococcus maripaludis]MBM7408369.1 hypothetical protein [Methanococcus maripaludis]MBP2220039.1 hypothetical protein [Methanococcus maripaludis]
MGKEISNNRPDKKILKDIRHKLNCSKDIYQTKGAWELLKAILNYFKRHIENKYLLFKKFIFENGPVTVFLVTSIIAIYTWKNSYYKPWDDFFKVISDIGTFLAAIFALSVISQMKKQDDTMIKTLESMNEQKKIMEKQVESSYMPHLVLSTKRFKLSYNHRIPLIRDYYAMVDSFPNFFDEFFGKFWDRYLKGKYLPMDFTDIAKGTISNVKLSSGRPEPFNLYLDLLNIGFGSAKDITCEWLVNINELNKFFDEHFKELPKFTFSSKKDWGPINHRAISFDLKDFSAGFSQYIPKTKHYLSHILPLGHVENSNLKIPPNFLKLFSLYIHNEVLGQKKIYGTKPNFKALKALRDYPLPVYLLFNYTDLYDNKKTLMIKLSVKYKLDYSPKMNFNEIKIEGVIQEESRKYGCVNDYNYREYIPL